MSETTYTAAIATASDCVAGDYCDVTVAEDTITYYADANGDHEERTMGTDVVFAAEINVRTDDEDKLAKVKAAAEDILRANGWVRTGSWTITDNALYATVERL